MNLEEIRKEAIRLQEDTLFTAQQHFIGAKWWIRSHYTLGLIATVAGVVATTTAVTRLPNCGENSWIAPTTVTVLAAVIAFLRPDAKSEIHYDKGVRYDDLRRKLRVFVNVTLSALDPVLSQQEALDRLNFFEEQKTSLNREKPTAPSGLIYFLAKREIEHGHSTHVVDRK